jgi:Zn-finger protein
LGKAYGINSTIYKKTRFGQSIWDKVRCYWEHVEEHLENSGNILKNPLKTWWKPKKKKF